MAPNTDYETSKGFPNENMVDIMVAAGAKALDINTTSKINSSQQSTTSSDVINTKATAIQKVRTSFSNGYGDFCFVPMFGGKGQLVIKDIQVMELDGYCRAGPFPYFELPLEIRQRILQLTLESLFEWSSTTKRQHIRVFISENEPEEIPHPIRRARYNMQFGASNGGRDGWDFKAWIRQLSSVNIQFREEVSGIIWSNTTVIAYYANLSLISDFLLDRPRTWKGIKSLHFNLPFHGGALDRLPEFCDWFSGNFLLDRLSLQIFVQEDELEDIVHGVGAFATLTSLRQINVKDKFTIVLSIKLVDEDSDYSGQNSSQYDHQKRLVSKYEPRFLKLAMPNSLRVQALPIPTEMQEYLSTRSATRPN